MQFYSRKRRSPAINIISLIDILCIVLIFFIVTTTFKKEEPMIAIDLPESSQAKATQETPPTILYVTSASKVFLDNSPVTVEGLAALLKRKVAASPSFKIALKASKEAPFGVIVKVMDAARLAGIEQLPTYTEEAPAAP
jgi:biopolymer transport protein ExbD